MKRMIDDLRELGRLDAEGADASQRFAPFRAWPKSTATSASVTTTSPVPDHDRLAVGPVVDTHHQRDEHQAEQRPGSLLEQKEYGSPLFSRAMKRRRAVDHHHAGADEEHRGGKQQLV